MDYKLAALDLMLWQGEPDSGWCYPCDGDRLTVTGEVEIIEGGDA